MDFAIKRFIKGRWDGTEYWKDYPSEPVRQYARMVVAAGSADRVEVRDMADRLLFQWPRTLRRA